MSKRLTFAALLLCLVATLASAKNYTVSFKAVTQVGSVKLAPGMYTLKVNGSNAVFTPVNGKEGATAEVKSEKLPKKASYTAVESKSEEGFDKVEAISLEGTDTRLVF